MIVKTGANYQAEGGYIEFSADNPNGMTMINGRPVPTTLNSRVLGITGYMRVAVKKTPESSGQVRVIQYTELTSKEGVKYRDYIYYTVTTSNGYIETPIGFGLVVQVPSGMTPTLAEGSKDVQFIHSANDTPLLFITGENPVAVLSYSEE